MDVVPVIDLKDGQVVHARGGRRDDYRPIRTPLCPTSEPVAVVRALLGLHAFRRLYVADLDAIEGRGGHDEVLEILRRDFPDLGLWVDNGLSRETSCLEWLARELGDLVIGSESQSDTALLAALGERGHSGRSILSLDFKGDRFLGPPALLQDAGSWPERVIVMTLARVGGAEGPDFDRLRQVRARAPAARIYAAGGVRGAADLQRLSDNGIHGALIASALHDGRLGADQLERLTD